VLIIKVIKIILAITIGVARREGRGQAANSHQVTERKRCLMDPQN